MKIVTRLAAALGGVGVAFNGPSSLLRRGGGSLGLRRSIHLVPSCGHLTEPPDSPAIPAAAKDPTRWILLNRRDCRRVTDDEDDSMAADNKTVAESRTSTGQQRLRVSFRLAAPPATSFLYYHCVGTAADGENIKLAVIAAHGDSVILGMTTTTSTGRRGLYEHFVYRAGTTTRPPSLSLLPAVSIPVWDDHCRPVLLDDDTGVLRRGEDEILVAQLELGKFEHEDTAHLCLLHLGRKRNQNQWELKRSVPIVHEQGDKLVGWLTGTSIAIPVGDRFLCWVTHRASFILCDMAAEDDPRLRHVPLPSTPFDPTHYTNDLLPLSDSEGMGAAGHGAVRFVAIEPRCCCGRFGRTSCARSRYAFTVTTWTLALTMDEPLTWVKDGVLDCEELWAMPGYDGLPRGHLQSPVVSLDNPDVVCFKVARVHRDQHTWMIQVDTRRKTLLAAVPWPTHTNAWESHLHLPAKL